MGARISALAQTGPAAHPASCTMVTGSFPGVKCGRGVTLTPHPILVPWSTKSRVIPLLPLWAVRPVQSLSACKRVHFTAVVMYRVRNVNIPSSSLCFMNLSSKDTSFFFIDGSVHRETNLITVQQDATYLVYYIFLKAALHVSGADTYHQELVQL